MKGFAEWILSKQVMLFFLFSLLFILINFLLIIKDTFIILEANALLSKIEDSFSQILFINLKSVTIKMPRYLMESTSEKTLEYQKSYKLYIGKNNQYVYFIISIKNKDFQNITGTSLKAIKKVVFIDCGSFSSFSNCITIENDKIKKIKGIIKNLLVFDSRTYRYLSIKKINGIIYILIR